MKYYLIAGEASGDLHASCLMQELQRQDAEAQFRFFGGDKMKAIGGTLVRHYRELAYMGVVPVLLHAHTILKNMNRCKKDIIDWKPDVLILIDYPGFNLNIAKYLHRHTDIPIHYYIAPKLWAWKEYRIKNIKRDVNKLFSILPFERIFFEEKHGYKIEYVGNPTAEEIRKFNASYARNFTDFIEKNALKEKPIIALLAGSRKQEIKDNLGMMLEAANAFPQYQFVIAGAPSISKDFYSKYVNLNDNKIDVHIVYNKTYELLANSEAALVTSGTATLETALLNIPQVVCYYTPMGKFISMLKKLILKVKYISLVNLIMNQELVTELVADKMKIKNIRYELGRILKGEPHRDEILAGYKKMHNKLGSQNVAENTAKFIIQDITERKRNNS